MARRKPSTKTDPELLRQLDAAVATGATAVEAAGSKLALGMTVACAMFDGATTAAAAGTRKALAVAEISANHVGHAAMVAVNAAGSAVSAAAVGARRSASTVATAALDQNGDGKLDQQDLKIMTEKGVALARATAEEAGVLAKQVASSELVRDAAAGAAVGAAIAIPVPLVGPGAGAVAGAAIGVYAHLRKK